MKPTTGLVILSVSIEPPAPIVMMAIDPSTPILNPPQCGILGMHKITERAVVEKGQIVVRPVMYVAMSYDHRIIDGSDSVQFLVTIKELLEDPARLLLQI